MSEQINKIITENAINLVIELIDNGLISITDYRRIEHVVKESHRFDNSIDYDDVEEFCGYMDTYDRRNLLNTMGIDENEIDRIKTRLEDLELDEFTSLHEEMKFEMYKKLAKVFSSPHELEEALTEEAREKIKYVII